MAEPLRELELLFPFTVAEGRAELLREVLPEVERPVLLLLLSVRLEVPVEEGRVVLPALVPGLADTPEELEGRLLLLERPVLLISFLEEEGLEVLVEGRVVVVAGRLVVVVGRLGVVVGRTVLVEGREEEDGRVVTPKSFRRLSK